MKGKTIINITHKLDSLKGKAKIIVINEGKVTDEGSYYNLMAREGFFADMISIRLTQTIHD